MLEALLGTFVVAVEVRVELLAQSIELGLDLLCRGIAADAEGLVVVVAMRGAVEQASVGQLRRGEAESALLATS